MTKKIDWRHSRILVLSGLWALGACGGEARSESDVPEGGTPVVALDDTDRPTLIEREEGAVAARDAGMPPVALAMGGAPGPDRAAEAEAAPEPASEPEPLPRYTTRSEPDNAESVHESADDVPGTDGWDQDGRPEPRLTATDGPGQIVEAEPADDVGGYANSDGDLGEYGEGGFTSSDTGSLTIPAGFEIELAVESEVSTERHVAGDYFYVTLRDDLLADDGLVLMARGARLRGVVTYSQPSESADSLPALEFLIEAVVTPTGERPVEASVVYADLLVDERDSGEETAVKVVTGAAAGAILGRILGGDKRDALKGGVAGAAAGAAVALQTRGGHARLEPGGLVVIRLEQPLIVSD